MLTLNHMAANFDQPISHFSSLEPGLNDFQSLCRRSEIFLGHFCQPLLPWFCRYVKILPINMGDNIQGIQRGSCKKCGEDCDEFMKDERELKGATAKNAVIENAQASC